MCRIGSFFYEIYHFVNFVFPTFVSNVLKKDAQDDDYLDLEEDSSVEQEHQDGTNHFANQNLKNIN